MAKTLLPTPEVLALLGENPRQIAALTAGLDAAGLQTPPAPGQWSFNDILAHLRSCADVWGDCIARILAEDNPTLRAMDPRTWTERTDYRSQPFRASFEAFTAQRAALLAALEPLTPEQWAREATVVGAGKPLVRSVHFYARWLAEHERSHVKHIRRMVKGR